MKRKNIFVVGLDDFDLGQLKNVHNAERYDFLPLFRYGRYGVQTGFPVKECLEEAERRLSAIPVNEFWGIVHTKKNVLIKEIVAIPVDI